MAARVRWNWIRLAMANGRRLRQLAGLAVLVIALFLLVDPLKGLGAQRADLASTKSQVARLSAENQALEAVVAKLNNPTYLGRLARQEFDLIKPGQLKYVVLPGSRATQAANPSGQGSTAAPATTPTLSSSEPASSPGASG